MMKPKIKTQEQIKESKRLAQKKWRNKNRKYLNEKVKEWRKKNPVKSKEISRRSYYKDQQKSIERRKKYYKENRDKVLQKMKEHNRLHPEKRRAYREKYKIIFGEKLKQAHKEKVIKNRTLIFNHYGWECVCCGEDNPKFLTVDHINNNGNKHRKEIHITLHQWLINNNFPEGFRILCYNCNCGRAHNGGICPHKEER